MSGEYKGHNKRLSKGVIKMVVNLSQRRPTLKKICSLPQRARRKLDVNE